MDKLLTDLNENDDVSSFSTKFSNKLLADQSRHTMNNIFVLKSSVGTTGATDDSDSVTQSLTLNDLQAKQQLHDAVSRFDIEIKKNNELDNVKKIFFI